MSLSWSFSKWESYNKCPAYFQYRHIERLPEPENRYAARGTELHKSAENFVSGKSDSIDGAFTYHYEFVEHLRHDCEGAKLEYQIALDEDWNLTDWQSGWVRMVLDVYHNEDADPRQERYGRKIGEGFTDTLIVDYKSGKIREEKHIAQMQLYAIGAMRLARHYEMHHVLNDVNVHLLYLDQQKTLSYTYGLEHENTLMQNWMRSIEPMQNDKKFLPKPNDTCKWCHFRKSNKGPCKFG
jgi:CRISPR/Cas system-associated exonuclease Cas4 (RecB family)